MCVENYTQSSIQEGMSKHQSKIHRKHMNSEVNYFWDRIAYTNRKRKAHPNPLSFLVEFIVETNITAIFYFKALGSCSYPECMSNDNQQRMDRCNWQAETSAWVKYVGLNPSIARLRSGWDTIRLPFVLKVTNRSISSSSSKNKYHYHYSQPSIAGWS